MGLNDNHDPLAQLYEADKQVKWSSDGIAHVSNFGFYLLGRALLLAFLRLLDRPDRF